MNYPNRSPSAFTLIELSVVLVIVGLLIGAVLVGQDLIRAATVRAQISQIEKLNAALLAFRAKFTALPGDMTSTKATKYGFTVGNNCLGQWLGARDGNGILDDWQSPDQLAQGGWGENTLFWMDLSSPIADNLIDGTYPSVAGSAVPGCNSGVGQLTLTPGTTYVGNYQPQAKIGAGHRTALPPALTAAPMPIP